MNNLAIKWLEMLKFFWWSADWSALCVGWLVPVVSLQWMNLCWYNMWPRYRLRLHGHKLLLVNNCSINHLSVRNKHKKLNYWVNIKQLSVSPWGHCDITWTLMFNQSEPSVHKLIFVTSEHAQTNTWENRCLGFSPESWHEKSRVTLVSKPHP